MRIGIIGAGKVGGGLGKLWARAGHQVFFSSRHPDRLKVLVEYAGPGAYSGNVADAAHFGDVILFSPNFWSVDDALEVAGPLEGKTVVDVTNPLEWNPNGRMVRSLSRSTTAGEELAKKLPNAQVVKAFSTIPASFIPHAFFRPGKLQRLVVFYCGDRPLSKVAVDRLISDSGFVGLDAGPLRLASELEAPRRLYRAGLIGIMEARRLLKKIADSVLNVPLVLVSSVSDQPAFAAMPALVFRRSSARPGRSRSKVHPARGSVFRSGVAPAGLSGLANGIFERQKPRNPQPPPEAAQAENGKERGTEQQSM
jgi:8-hydroxy-5-deazaflavin:NADPH oxidoreductase